MRREDIRRWLEGLGAVLLIGALIAVLHLCGARICLFHRLTGLPCLTCGTSRAFALLMSGHIADAFVTQPLAVLAATAVFSCVLIQACFIWCGRIVLSVHFERRERIALGAVTILLVIANWIWLIVRGV